jgi:hypothetical protein
MSSKEIPSRNLKRLGLTILQVRKEVEDILLQPGEFTPDVLAWLEGSILCLDEALDYFGGSIYVMENEE